MCLTIDAEKHIVKLSGELNPHYIETRYPVEAEYSEEIGKNALENARTVIAWVKKKLKELQNA